MSKDGQDILNFPRIEMLKGYVAITVGIDHSKRHLMVNSKNIETLAK